MPIPPRTRTVVGAIVGVIAGMAVTFMGLMIIETESSDVIVFLNPVVAALGIAKARLSEAAVWALVLGVGSLYYAFCGAVIARERSVARRTVIVAVLIAAQGLIGVMAMVRGMS